MALPKTCEEFEAALPLFVGSDLEGDEMEAVRRHLDDCEHCRGELRRAQAARDVLISLRGGHESGSGSSAQATSLWEGMRDVLASEGMFAGERETGPTPIAVSSSGEGSRAGAVSPGGQGAWAWSRMGIGGVAAAAAILFAFTLAGRFGPGAGPLDGADGLQGAPAVASSTLPEAAHSVDHAASAAGFGAGNFDQGTSAMPASTVASTPSIGVPVGDAVQRLRRAGENDEHLFDTARTLQPGAQFLRSNGAGAGTQVAGNR